MTIEINTLHTLQSLDIKIITKKQNNVGQWGAGLERAECWCLQPYSKTKTKVFAAKYSTRQLAYNKKKLYIKTLTFSTMASNIGMLSGWALMVWEKKAYVLSLSRESIGTPLTPMIREASDMSSCTTAPLSVNSW